MKLQHRKTHINFNKQVYVALSFYFFFFFYYYSQAFWDKFVWQAAERKCLLKHYHCYRWLSSLGIQLLSIKAWCWILFTVWEATLAWLWLISKHLTCHCHIIHCTFFNFLMLLKLKDWIGCAVQCCCIEKKHRKYNQCLYLCKLLEKCKLSTSGLVTECFQKSYRQLLYAYGNDFTFVMKVCG